MDPHETYKETLLFINFNGTVTSDILENTVFFRAANLDTKNPLIQINDFIFQGHYEYSVGTNLFFKKTTNSDPLKFPFKDPTPEKLEFYAAQCKVLSCKQMKIPSSVAPLPEQLENIKFNFDWDYNELLKKLENGTLDLEDMVLREEITRDETAEEDATVSNSVEEERNERMEICDDTETEKTAERPLEVSEIQNVGSIELDMPDELEIAYANLLILARTPVKRDITHEEALCVEQYKNRYDYLSIECKILERPLFSYMKNTSTGNDEDFVNLERCVTLGLIQPSDRHPRILSSQEKSKVMTIENMENLDLNARYAVLFAHREKLEKEISSNTAEENNSRDEYGRTSTETLEIIKRLLDSIRRRVHEINFLEATPYTLKI